MEQMKAKGFPKDFSGEARRQRIRLKAAGRRRKRYDKLGCICAYPGENL